MSGGSELALELRDLRPLTAEIAFVPGDHRLDLGAVEHDVDDRTRALERLAARNDER
jgi:hypothetical protein